jgi:dipeptidyl aminopeptidase/acylaminoacyl peptidase
MKRSHYGTWRSPFSAADIARSAMSLDIARSAISLNYVQVANNTPYWVESDRTRSVIMTVGTNDRVEELTPAGFSVRTRVNETPTGRPYAVWRDTAFFSNAADQRLYVQRPGARPVAFTPEGYRYADFEPDSFGTRLYCVREDHTGSGEPKNTICSVAVEGVSAGTVLFSESDFVAYPRVSPDGRRLAWIAWNHPHMAWDMTTLYVAELREGGLSHVTAIAGGPGESVVEPRWDSDGSLYFISDRSNWWNLYRFRNNRVETVLSIEAELATPLWALSQSNYTLTGDGRAVVRYGVDGFDRLGVLTLDSAKFTRLDVPFVGLSSVQLLDPQTAVAIAASATAEPVVAAIDLRSGSHRVLRARSEFQLDAAYISLAEPVEFRTSGEVKGHAFYCPPTNPEYAPPAGEKPPVLVKVHLGPAGQSKPECSLSTQYWTSRGFAVVDVNFRGSSGFGRAYRDLIYGNWGVVDVEDVVAALKHFADAGLVDGKRAAIRGGSSAGFTALAAMVFSDAFRAGASYAGICDLETTIRGMGSFKAMSRYFQRAAAPLPQSRVVYEARSPIYHSDAFKAPLIFFQGKQDRLVTPSESLAVVAALKRKGIPVAYVEFEGEGHGFGDPESIRRSLETELAFYGQVFGFAPAGPIESVNLE